jgi:hypothetical protein
MGHAVIGGASDMSKRVSIHRTLGRATSNSQSGDDGKTSNANLLFAQPLLDEETICADR